MANSQGSIVGALDYDKLVETFSQICPDFQDSSNKSQSLGFAAKVLYELSPKMSQLKKNGEDEMWRLDFYKEKNMNDKASTYSVFVYTYRFNRPTNVQPRLKDNKLYLTLKQATLLATDKLCRATPLGIKPNDIILLTPLSRAIFNPKNIPKIALDLSRLTGRSVSCSEVLKTVISSCQTDGFHLSDSAVHVAIVAIQINYTVDTQREKMRAKTLRVYKKHGKEFDANQYEVYARHSKRNAAELRAIVQQCNEIELEESIATSSQASHEMKLDVSTAINKIFKRSDDPLTGSALDIKPIDLNLLQLNAKKAQATITTMTKEPSNIVLSNLVAMNATDYETLQANVIGTESKYKSTSSSTATKVVTQ